MSDNDKREKVEVYADNLRRAYDKADDNTRVVLDALFGTIHFGGEDGNKPDLKDYKTIRTYEDACVALGERVDEETLKAANVPAHIIAEMKLELVCKALWGGVNNCNPCEDGKVWWYPCMAFWTKDEIADKDDEDRVALLSARASSGAGAGFGCLWMRMVGVRGRMRTGASACALTPKKRQNTLSASSWNCGLNIWPTTSRLEGIWSECIAKFQGIADTFRACR